MESSEVSDDRAAAVDNEFVSIIGRLAQIEDTDERAALLTDIQLVLTSISDKRLRAVVSRVSLDALFGCFAISDSNICDTTTLILSRILEAYDPFEAFDQYKDQLITGIDHPQVAVRRLCCVQLLRILRNDVSRIVEESAYLKRLIDFVICEDNSDDLYKLAGEALVLIGSSKVGHPFLFSVNGDVLIYFKSHLFSCSSTIWFRLMQVVVDSCVKNAQALCVCETNGLLRGLSHKAVDSDDILSQAVAIETMSQLATCQHGYTWLINQNVMSVLMTLLRQSPADNPFINLVQPAILSFFGSAAYHHATLLYGDHPEFFTRLCELIVLDTELISNAVDTLAHIAMSNSAKLVLTKLGSAFTKTLQQLGHIAMHGTSSLRIITLSCIASIVDAHPDLDLKGSDRFATEEVEALCHSWFCSIHPQPLEFLLKLSKQPFQDLRCATLGVYLSLAKQAWGQQAMRDHPTFCEYLLDRSTEKEKEGHELKFKVVCAILESQSGPEIFGQPYIIKLKVYHKQGPFYAQARAEVAMEEA